VYITAQFDLLHKIIERQGQRFRCCFRKRGREGRVVTSHDLSDVFKPRTIVET
jgi:hypothetical protein